MPDIEWSEAAITAAREYHTRRDEERRQRLERLRAQTLAQVSAAIQQVAPTFPSINAVHLFGSLVQPGRFHPDSDIDVAVVAADVETESRFWRALEDALGREVDVRPLSGGVAFAVESYGQLLYEREDSASGTQH